MNRIPSVLVGICCFALFGVRSATADWFLFNKVMDSKIYVKKDRSAGAKGNTIYVLYDYGSEGEYGDYSSVYLYETNCKTGYIRARSFQYLDEEMGRGSVVKDGPNGTSWECPKKGTLLGSIAAFSCEDATTPNGRSIVDLINKNLFNDHCSEND